jgi:Na+/H+ antiporter NhaC
MKIKKIFAGIFILGVIFLCAFCAPHSYKHSSEDYSNIFSPDGELEIPKMSFYIILWAILCYVAVFVFDKQKVDKNSN